MVCVWNTSSSLSFVLQLPSLSLEFLYSISYRVDHGKDGSG